MTAGSVLPLPALPHVARVVVQHPLHLLRRQPATQPPLRVLLSARDERLPKALVQAGTAGVIGVGVAPLRITFRRRCVHACRVYSASSPAISLNALS